MVVNVSDLSGACAVLERRHPKLVVCDADIDGPGSWRDLLKLREDLLSFALVVASRNADDALWAEVLNLGGFDLLQKPFNAAGVGHVVELAAQASRQERGRPLISACLAGHTGTNRRRHETIPAAMPKAGDG
jgi:DNA-binding NarL/FixJ family response regulator